MEPEEFIESISSSNQSPQQILDYLRSENVQEKYIKLAEDYFSKQQDSPVESNSIGLDSSEFKIYDPNEVDVNEDFESFFIIDDNPNEVQKIWNLGVAQGMLGRIIAKAETTGDLDENKLSYFNRVIRDNQPEKGDFLQSDKTVAGFALDVLRTVPQSLISMATAAPAGLPGAALGLVNPIAGFAGFAGGTSLAIEYGSSMMSSLQEAGVDVYDPDAVQDAFKNPEKMEEARSYALKRGIPVAVFDAISGGTGGRIAGSIRKSARKSLGIGQALPSSVTAKAALAEVGTQAGLGAAGEFSGQMVAGDEINPRDILLEGFAELAPASPSMINEYIKSKRSDSERGTFLEQSRSKVFNEINEENKKLDVKDKRRKTVDQIEEEVEDRMIASSEVYSIVLDGQEQLNDIQQSIEDNTITSKDDNASRKQKSLAEKLLQEALIKKENIQKTIQKAFFSLPASDQIKVQRLFEESKILKSRKSKSNSKQLDRNKIKIQEIFKKQRDDSKKEAGVSSPIQEGEISVEGQPIKETSVEETKTDRDVQENKRVVDLDSQVPKYTTPEGKEVSGEIKIDRGGKVTFESEDQIFDLGNVNDQESLAELNIESEEIFADKDGSFNVLTDFKPLGKKSKKKSRKAPKNYVNVNKNKTEAITFAEDGSVESVTLFKSKTDGNIFDATEAKTFTGKQATFIAYNILLREAGNFKAPKDVKADTKVDTKKESIKDQPIEQEETIKEEDKSLVDESKKQIDNTEKSKSDQKKGIRQRLSEFFLWNEAQKEVIKLKESLSGRITTEGRKIKEMTSTLTRLLKQDPNAVPYVNKIFDGSITDQEQNELDALVLGKQISAQASSMRTYVDSLSNSLVNDPAFVSLPESTKKTIQANMGTYMRNSYKFFKDRKFKPSEALKQDAIEYVYNQLLAQEIAVMSRGELGARKEVSDISEESKEKLLDAATTKVNNYLTEIDNIRNNEGFQASGLVRSGSIKLPNKQLKSRNKDLPEAIQALLGIEKDPITRFNDTVIALSNIKYKGMFIYDTLKITDESAVKDEITSTEKANKEYREINDEFSPLNGKFVRSDLFEVISDEALYQSDVPALQAYFNILKLSRKSKVIWNIPTWRKNLTGGWYTMMANGVINNKTLFDIKERSKALVGTAQGKDILDKETTQMLELMGEYGLLGSSVNANFAGLMDLTIGSAIEGTPADGKIKTFLDKAGLSFEKFDKWSTENYSFVDDYTKLVIFRQEIPSMARKLYGKEVTDENGNYSKEKFDALTEDQKVEVYRTAAEMVKESTPTFSRLPRFYKKLAKLPFGDFLGFELEAIRSLYMNLRNATRDLKKATKDKSLDSVQRNAYLKAGLSRTFGVATLLGFRAALATTLASLFLGEDEDLDEYVKALRPDWMAGHSLIATKVTKDGNVSVYDYSLEDPYGGVFDIITDPFGFPKHVWEMLGPNMAAELIFNLTKGKDVYGRDIAENTDDLFNKVLKYTSYGAKQTIIPPFISSYYRDYIKKGEAENAIDYFSGLVSRTTIRDYRYNANTQFYFNVKELKSKEDFDELNSSSKKVRTKQLEEVKKQYEAIVNISLGKKNYKMRSDAIKTIKRNFKGKERLYILYGYEL